MQHLKSLLAWLLLPPIAIVFIAFAIANRAAVAISLDPLPFVLQPPLFLLVFAAIFLGLAVGGLIAWGKALRWRRLAAERLRQVQKLEARPASAAAASLPAGATQR